MTRLYTAKRGQTEAITKLLLVGAGILIAGFAIQQLWGQVRGAAGGMATAQTTINVDSSDGECVADMAQAMDECLRRGLNSKRNVDCYKVNLKPQVTGEKCASDTDSCVCPDLRGSGSKIADGDIKGMMSLVGPEETQIPPACSATAGFCMTTGGITKATKSMNANFKWRQNVRQSQLIVKMIKDCRLYGTSETECNADLCLYNGDADGECDKDCTKYAYEVICKAEEGCKWDTTCKKDCTKLTTQANCLYVNGCKWDPTCVDV